MPRLDTADAMFVGSGGVDKVYMGDEQVWPAVSGGFSPTDLAGLGLWLDPTVIVGLTDGDPVSTWENLGSAGDATQTGGGRPTYETAVINGLPVVRFVRASSHWMSVPDHADLELNGNSTSFAVIERKGAAGSYGMSIFSKDTGGASAGAFYWYLTESGHLPRLDRPYVEGGAGTPTAVALNTPSLITLKVSGTTATHYLNGVQTATDTIATGSATSQPLRIGAFKDSASVVQFGDIDRGDQLIYHGVALSDVDRASVETYLLDKWGI